MKDPLVRFGVAIEDSLLRELDELVEERGCTRSELLRDLARSEVGRAKVARGVDAVCTLTLVYDHHVRDLGEKLTELQHQLGEGVRASLHVHLTHDLCLEVVVMRGRSDRLQAIADRILAMRGVKQGGIEIVPGLEDGVGLVRAEDRHARGHGHPHAHDHAHAHAHPHGDLTVADADADAGPPGASGRGVAGRRPGPARTGAREPPPARPRRGRIRRG